MRDDVSQEHADSNDEWKALSEQRGMYSTVLGHKVSHIAGKVLHINCAYFPQVDMLLLCDTSTLQVNVQAGATSRLAGKGKASN